MQDYDSFGSGTTVKGSYYYDRYREPIPIYGKYNDGKLNLCEVSQSIEMNSEMEMDANVAIKTSICPLSLTIGENIAVGLWGNSTNSYKVELQKTAIFDDTGDKAIAHGIVEIPFWSQTKNHMFLGIYISNNSGKGCLKEIKVTNKINGKTDYKIPFNLVECNAGFLMTPIYMNIQNYNAMPKDSFIVHFHDSRNRFSRSYGLDKKANKYRYIKNSLTKNS